LRWYGGAFRALSDPSLALLFLMMQSTTDFNAYKCWCILEWENLSKLVEKAKAVLDKEGVPRFLSKLLVNLEDYLNQTDADKDKKSKMSKTNSKAFNSMKQKMKKWTKATPKIEAAMQQYRSVRLAAF
jgi:hypothetical protein